MATPIQLKPRFGLPAVCVLCGYDLRGSTESKRCPECGEDFDGDTLICTREPSRKWMLGTLPLVFYTLWMLVRVFPKHWDRWSDWLLFLYFPAWVLFIFFLGRSAQKPLAGNVFFQCDARGYIAKSSIKKPLRKCWIPDMELHLVLNKRGCSLNCHRGGIAIFLEADEVEARLIQKKLTEWARQRVTLERQ